jgi:hypothetical protein
VTDAPREASTPAEAFQVLTRAMADSDGRLSPRQVTVLELAGKALGVPADERIRLALTPADWSPGVERLIGILEPFLGGVPAEIREDLNRLVSETGEVQSGGPPAPVCPRCRSPGSATSRRIWRPPPQAGLDPLEGTVRSHWSCLGCQAVLECVDAVGEDHRSRQLRVALAGEEVRTMLRRLEAAGDDADAAAEALSRVSAPSWLLERVWGAPRLVWTALGRARSRLRATPEVTAEAYAEPQALVRLGPPPSAESWRRLLAAAPSSALLRKLASYPGAPPEARRTLLEHPDPEVQYQALQAPDLSTEVLREVLESGAISRVMAILDRPDVGEATLNMALDRGDPHLVYRICRHPGLNLVLLERTRRLRRGGRADPMPATRSVQVYAPTQSRRSASLLDRCVRHLEAALPDFGWEVLEEDAEETPEEALEVTIAHVTQSRVILILPEDLDLADIRGEHLLDALGRSFVADFADEVLTLHLDEASGFWESRIRRPDEEPQRAGARGLPPEEGQGDPGRWLEFELFCAERALPFPGLGVDHETPRLETRPPYLGADEQQSVRRRITLLRRWSTLPP